MLIQALDEEAERRIAVSIFFVEAVFVSTLAAMCVWAQLPKHLNHRGSDCDLDALDHVQ